MRVLRQIAASRVIRQPGGRRESGMALATRLTKRLGIAHPLLLAPMGSVSGGALAAAVTSAGGLGLIGGAYGDSEWVERQFGVAGNRRVGCGFITWSLARRPRCSIWRSRTGPRR
jgi:hypothetical protein